MKRVQSQEHYFKEGADGVRVAIFITAFSRVYD